MNDERDMRSDRYTILAGPGLQEFNIPQDLLFHYSPVLETMCHLKVEEEERTDKRVITLPKEDPSILGYFIMWIHAVEPSIKPLDLEYTPAIGLAIFAEKYQVLHLKNQVSDLIRKKLGYSKESWRMTPEIISKIFKNTPENATLRRLCAFSLVPIKGSYSYEESHIDDSSSPLWKQVFNDHPNLGWDFAKEVLFCCNTDYSSRDRYTWACNYHDHSDIANFEAPRKTDCDYPHGAPLKDIEHSTESKPTIVTTREVDQQGKPLTKKARLDKSKS